MATKPTQLAEWDTEETNVEEPAAGLIQSGWGTDAVPPSAYFNWWQNLVGKWTAYLDDLEAQDFEWTGEHAFTMSGSDSFSVVTADGGYIDLSSKLIALQHEARDDNSMAVLWGSFAFDRVRTFVIEESLWFVWNAIYQDDGTWDFVDNGQRAHAFVLGGTAIGGFSKPGFLVRDAGEADGWTTANWHLAPTSFAAGAGAINRESAVAVTINQNSWTASVAVKSVKAPDGKVTLCGAITGGTSGNYAGTLPSHHWPATAKVFACIEAGTNTVVKVVIGTDGRITATGTNTNVYLDGISFYE